jgi:hypothetical protein
MDFLIEATRREKVRETQTLGTQISSGKIGDIEEIGRTLHVGVLIE